MAGELTIEVNNDGTATINFGGGAMHTVSPSSTGPNVVKSLQDAYGDRIGNVVQSGVSSAEQANKSAGFRQQQRDDVLSRTQNGVGLITDTTGNGYSTEDIQNYVNSAANAAAGRFSSVEDAVNKTAANGKKILSKYFSADEIAGMSTKQLLAASELNYQGNGDTGRTNGLSVQDLDFIVNKANTFAASVWSPNTQAISTGYDPVAAPVITSPGISQDTRNWSAIVASDNPVIAAQIATNQMYGGTSVDYVSGGYQYDANGDLVRDAMGQPVKEAPSLHLVGGNGAIIQKITDGMQNLPQVLQNFGVRDTSWLSGMQQYMPPGMVSSLQNYNPYADFSNLWENTYITGVAEATNPFFELEKEKKATTITSDTTQNQNLGVTEQTITPEGTTETETQTVTQSTYDSTPQASEAVPVNQQQTVGTGVTGTGVYPQTGGTTGTFPSSTQTGGIGAVPSTVQTYPNYTGTSMANLTTPSQYGVTTPNISVPNIPTPQFNIPQVGQTYQGQPMVNAPVRGPGIMGGGRGTGSTPYSGPMSGGVGSGNPTAPRPSLSQLSPDQELVIGPDGWYVRAYTPSTYGSGFQGMFGFNEGGSVSEGGPDVQLARRFLGFTGPASQLTNFLAANPAAAARMGKYQQAMSGMAQNKVGANEGIVGTSLEDFQNMQKNLVSQTMQPVQSGVQQIQPQAADFVGLTAGQATPVSPMSQVATVGNVEQAQMPMMTDTATMTPASVFQGVQGVTAANQAAQGTIQPGAVISGQQQLTTSVSGVEAAQGTATLVNAPDAREIQAGELISGAADAEKAATFNEQIQAATATPSKQATVQGQLEGLMQQFEGGNTPAWAAGSMRTAMQTLAARGLGASSLAGQAVIQAAMEAALPVAQMDAQTQAQFEAQNLSNRQQRAMLAAQQRAQFLGQEFDQAFQARVANSARIGDIANMNFTAEQQIALEDSRALNTMNLNNLSNRQAMVMAEAAALSQLDMANLNNRQQAAVQNAQNFLQMDMTNLNNQQQSALFNAQQNIQALFTDQAAENAAAQFNATSENQTNQFFANLSAQTSQFNASQRNAMDQFNVNTTNAMRQFNSQIQQQRDLFNAQNGLVVAQANAQWRQNIATLNQAAQNESNMNLAKTINALTSTNLDQIWQRERDIMSFAFTSQQSALDRSLKLLLGDKKIEEVEKQLSAQKDAAGTELAFRFLFGSDPSGLFGGIFNKP